MTSICRSETKEMRKGTTVKKKTMPDRKSKDSCIGRRRKSGRRYRRRGRKRAGEEVRKEQKELCSCQS